MRLDFYNPQRPVRARTRQDHPDRSVPVLFRHRSHEGIDGHMHPSEFLSRVQAKLLFRNRHRRVRRNHIDVIALDLDPVPDLGNSHRRLLRQQIGQDAVVFWVQMLDENKRKPSINGETFHKIIGCFDPARRCSDGHHDKPFIRFIRFRNERFFRGDFLFFHWDRFLVLLGRVPDSGNA